LAKVSLRKRRLTSGEPGGSLFGCDINDHLGGHFFTKVGYNAVLAEPQGTIFLCEMIRSKRTNVRAMFAPGLLGLAASVRSASGKLFLQYLAN
jgi:hypothetical protein